MKRLTAKRGYIDALIVAVGIGLGNSVPDAWLDSHLFYLVIGLVSGILLGLQCSELLTLRAARRISEGKR